MSLAGYGTLGHACPTERGVYTALHNVKPYADHPQGHFFTKAFAWEDGYENKGLLYFDSSSETRDLARAAASLGYVPYPLADENPEVGDVVYWKEYNLSDDVMTIIERESTVTQVIAGHIVMEHNPLPGASGGCLINRKGQAIGVVIWSFGGQGVSASIAGDWKPKK
jgi:hypothetical protein